MSRKLHSIFRFDSMSYASTPQAGFPLLRLIRQQSKALLAICLVLGTLLGEQSLTAQDDKPNLDVPLPPGVSKELPIIGPVQETEEAASDLPDEQVKEEVRQGGVPAEKPCYLLPDEPDWAAGIMSPKEFYGFELGEYHLRHHQLVGYLKYLAKVSDRIQIEEIGQSHGRRPLVLLTISSPENLTQIPEIQRLHQADCRPETQTATSASSPMNQRIGTSVQLDVSRFSKSGFSETTIGSGAAFDSPTSNAKSSNGEGGATGEAAIRSDEFKENGSNDGLMVPTIGTTANEGNSANELPLESLGQSASATTESKWKPVIYMGYSVHGDESSGANSVPAVAYYLAASQSPDVLALLDEVVVLLDPCLNPDGFDRFANWANDFRGRNLVADPNHREHNQAWPGGRVNYYWFDLNRDWLPAQHPESQARLAKFHQWKPNVVLDFHEMGTNSTFFFQPGIPTRNHPLTPKKNLQLTRAFAKYHAKALDDQGSIYFTEERFDDYYMGKGSTYPDLHGAVGILFEQASSRGHVQESIQGDLTFPFTIQNQFTCALSSLKATYELRDELRQQQVDFYQQALELAAAEPVRYYAFQAPGDMARLNSFAELLSRHSMDCYWLSESIEVDGQTLPAFTTLIVPTDQPEYRFLLALIERRTEFTENVFYDVSTWTLPLAFDLNSEAIPFRLDDSKLRPLDSVEASLTSIPNRIPEIGYALPWSNDDAPRMLAKLLRMGLHVRVAEQPFTARCDGVEVDFQRGTMVVPIGLQSISKGELKAAIESAEPGFIYPLDSGLTPQGIDLGSNQFRVAKLPKVLIVAGEGVNRYEAGDAWHYLDTRVELGVTLSRWSDLARLDLSRYTAIVMVSGRYDSDVSASYDNLQKWVESGGTLITIGSAVTWAAQSGLADFEFVESETDPESANEIQKPYASARGERALDLISGAIFNTTVDTTHPLGFGLSDKHLPVFRNNRVFLKPSTNPYANPVVYASEPLLSGYVSDANLELIKQSASVVVDARGAGRIIALSENPNFRAFWYGTNRLFVNSIFFGPFVQVP